MPTTANPQRWIGQQSAPVFLRPAPDTLRLEAAQVVASMSDELPEGDMRFAWSRARNGCTSNPIYRVALMFRALRKMGGSKADALLALTWLAGKVEALWADTRVSVKAAHEAEIQADAAECVAQYRAMTDPAFKRAYMDTLREQIAASMALLAALEAETN